MSAPSTPNLTALSTPNLGPQNFPARRGGSVSGGAWQLVEVNSKEDKKAVSQQNTPLVGAQRSPPTQPDGSPADLQEWNIDSQLPPAAETPEEPKGPPAGNGYNERGWGEDEEEEEHDPDAFNHQYFIGDWSDSLGNRVVVQPSESGGKQRDRRRRNKGGGKGKGKGGIVFLACMQKFGMPDKRFNINKDRIKSEWTCGNGVLQKEESGSETIKWKAPDGRINIWTRCPPEGPVYFDAPAAMMQDDGQHAPWWNQANGMQMHPNGPVYYASEQSAPPQGEWKDLHLPPDGDRQGNDGGSQGQEGTTSQWNVTAAEFVPSAMSAAAAPASVSDTPTLKPATAPSTPLLTAVSPQPVGVQAVACMLKLSEESPDVTIAANRLEWVLPDNWGKLNRFPKDFCLTSPMFGVRQATNMQLVFYPNGSRTAEAGRCTVALTRGPDSAGIKFEFSVNGRGSGPKVCLGRRYLGDYPKPYDESEDNKEQQVTVCMQVLEVLGI